MLRHAGSEWLTIMIGSRANSIATPIDRADRYLVRLVLHRLGYAVTTTEAQVAVWKSGNNARTDTGFMAQRLLDVTN